ncbi:MAG: hypothetical protein Rubg2KO_28230 [Rubricoccaceae bacterium]
MRFALLLFAAAALSLPATAQIQFEPQPMEPNAEAPDAPVQGHPVRIILDEPTESVQVVWRPNSAIPDTVSLDPEGTSFLWTPTRAGVATVITDGGTQNVSVRYDEFPGSGILVLVLAAGILFGGAGFAMGKLLSGDAPPALPMDT